MRAVPLLAACASILQFTFAARGEDTVPRLTARQLVFSVENMDKTVDPRKDFHSYASGT